MKTEKQNTINAHVGKDVFGFSLRYFDDDYNAATTDMVALSKNYEGETGDMSSYYNGNIRGMVVAMSDNDEQSMGSMLYEYKYDQLNRIKEMSSGLLTHGTTESILTAAGYSANYSFDPNGNLTSLKRWVENMSGTTVFMDDLTYKYDDPTNNTQNNRLTSVQDAQGQMMGGDLDDQDPFNYGYDEIGQLIRDDAEEIDEIEWKVNNKVKAVRRTATSELSDLEFEYDAFGRRIMKRVIPKLAGGSIDVLGITTTYYVLDAQGHTLTKYKVENFLNPDGTLGNKLYLVNRNIYGSKLLGQEEIYEVIASTDNNVVDINTNTDMVIGDKRYTLSNHLGNVHQVVTDRKIPEEDNGDIAYFYPDIVSHSDYLPFGMEIEARSSSSSETDFGFNGMYADDEWKGKRNSYDFGARMYDPRVGRWFSRDKNIASSIGVNDYHFVLNNPIRLYDGDGNVQRDCNGDIIVESTGQYTDVTHDSGTTWTVELVYVFADDGTKIQAFRNVSEEIKGANTNCHGTTFLDGRFWLNNDQVDLLIEHDDYEEVSNPADFQERDVLLYEYFDNDGGSDHSVTITNPGKSYDDTEVEGLGGVQTETSRQRAPEGWVEGSEMTVYRKKNFR